jgi:hypothetical protein
MVTPHGVQGDANFSRHSRPLETGEAMRAGDSVLRER